MLDVFNFTPHRLTVLERPQEDDPVTREYLECGCLKFSDGEVWLCDEHVKAIAKGLRKE